MGPTNRVCADLATLRPSRPAEQRPIRQIAAKPDAPGLATLLSWLSRFVSIEIETAGSVSAGHASAWATLAVATIEPANCAWSDATRALLHSLFDKADLSDAGLMAIFGTAARGLLAFA